MDEMAAGAQQISSSSQSVSNLALDTNRNIEVLQSKLGLFKV
jgi:methyl-accepting chemotaxis protein